MKGWLNLPQHAGAVIVFIPPPGEDADSSQVILGYTSVIPGMNKDLTALCPDIVVTHEPSRTVVIVEVAVSLENIFKILKTVRQQ